MEITRLINYVRNEMSKIRPFIYSVIDTRMTRQRKKIQ